MGLFKKILIANRSEIACRIIHTAKRLGIQTIAVYSEADQQARHVKLADEALYIGKASATESYLQIPKIIEAAMKTGAEAIHPGYGFLSENPDFSEALQQAGLVFIGPPAEAIRAMGLKDAAKQVMSQAGVPIVPGYHGDNQQTNYLQKQAQKTGYPVLIKARAGGGGKGMRRVDQPEQFLTALASAQSEAQASFGDAHCLIEKYITQPRHIEIQIFADQQGNVVHLFERDCSLQRRHQKVIEEAPAPDMPEAVREAMGQAAVEAAKAIGYQGAGTVEFIADSSQGLQTNKFWFMEMNTRLQVEHPVSEAISGYDFVELQLRIAAGEALPFQQTDLQINGWAMEARIYAEDVPAGFLPATGQLVQLEFPEAREFRHSHLRIDSGVQQGDEISPYYDPMIAKVIVHGSDRSSALQQLTQALNQCYINGLTTNVSFLSRLTQHADFRTGQVHTALIEQNLSEFIETPDTPQSVIALAALLTTDLLKEAASDNPWDTLSGWHHWSLAKHSFVLQHREQNLGVSITLQSQEQYQIETEQHTGIYQAQQQTGNTYRLYNEQQQITLKAFVKRDRDQSHITIYHNGEAYSFSTPDLLADVAEQTHTSDVIAAPMPGLIKHLAVAEGQSVSQGDTLLTLEAMKMEHTLTAPRDAVIKQITVSANEQISQNSILVHLEPAAEPPHD